MSLIERINALKNANSTYEELLFITYIEEYINRGVTISSYSNGVPCIEYSIIATFHRDSILYKEYISNRKFYDKILVLNGVEIEKSYTKDNYNLELAINVNPFDVFQGLSDIIMAFILMLKEYGCSFLISRTYNKSDEYIIKFLKDNNCKAIVQRHTILVERYEQEGD